MTIVYVFVATVPVESVTRTVNVYVPGNVGTPARSPCGSNARPGGNAPDSTSNV